MNLFLWSLAGIGAGLLGRKAPYGKGPWGVPGDLIAGVIGGVIGGWLFQNAPGQSDGGWIGSTFVAFIGAIIVLLSLRFAIGGRAA
jgi:uncharacterized membrane protein YeaQ/YmgE (transglycosylase-associated protein family)